MIISRKRVTDTHGNSLREHRKTLWVLRKLFVRCLETHCGYSWEHVAGISRILERPADCQKELGPKWWRYPSFLFANEPTRTGNHPFKFGSDRFIGWRERITWIIYSRRRKICFFLTPWKTAGTASGGKEFASLSPRGCSHLSSQRGVHKKCLFLLSFPLFQVFHFDNSRLYFSFFFWGGREGGRMEYLLGLPAQRSTYFW